MSTSKKTTLDRQMIAIAIVPPITLLLFCAVAAGKWQADLVKIRRMLEKSISPEVVDASLAGVTNDLANTSNEKTKAGRELRFVLDVLNTKYQMLFELLADQEDDQHGNAWYESLDAEREVDPYIRDYLREAEPLLRQMERLNLNPATTHPPKAFENLAGRRFHFVHRGPTTLLITEFQAAVRAKDTDRAIKAFRLFRSLNHSPLAPEVAEFWLLASESFATGIWSETELDQFVQMIDQAPDLDQDWQGNVHATIRRQLPWLLHWEGKHPWWSEQIPVTCAASHRVEWLRIQQELVAIRRIGTLGSIRKVREITHGPRQRSNIKWDAAIQIPSYGQWNDVGPSWGRVAEQYARVANHRRFARTAAAIAAFKLANGSYPSDLNDLAKVGLPPDQTSDPTGSPFLFEQAGKGCRLSNGSVWFPNRHNHVPFSARKGILSEVLRDYQVVRFP